jgi:amino acid transporter
MEVNSENHKPKRSVRYARFLSLCRTIALGASISVVLSVFVLLGLILDVSWTRAPLAFGLVALVFIPVVLAYAERALAIPGR